MAAEAQLVDKIVRALRSRGAWTFKTHGHPMQVAGIGDIIACYRGRFLMLEVKVPGERATPLQAYTLGEVHKTGGITAVVHSVEEALKALEEAEEPCALSPLSTLTS